MGLINKPHQIHIIKLNKETKEKIKILLNSDAVNYLETSERLTLKNWLDTEIVSESVNKKLDKIIQKYKKFIKT